MTATIIDGKETAKEKRGQLAKEVEELKKQGVTPGLAVILIGDDPANPHGFSCFFLSPYI